MPDRVKNVFILQSHCMFQRNLNAHISAHSGCFHQERPWVFQMFYDMRHHYQVNRLVGQRHVVAVKDFGLEPFIFQYGDS